MKEKESRTKKVKEAVLRLERRKEVVARRWLKRKNNTNNNAKVI